MAACCCAWLTVAALQTAAAQWRLLLRDGGLLGTRRSGLLGADHGHRAARRAACNARDTARRQRGPDDRLRIREWTQPERRCGAMPAQNSAIDAAPYARAFRDEIMAALLQRRPGGTGSLSLRTAA